MNQVHIFTHAEHDYWAWTNNERL